MEKALFLVFHPLVEYSGITKKIRYQVKALNDCGVQTQLACFAWDTQGNIIRKIDSKTQEVFGSGVIAKIKKRISYEGLTNYILENKIELLYIRSFLNAEPFLIHFVAILRSKGVEVVMEVPTYPYDSELKELPLADRITAYIDRVFRKSLASKLNYIVTFSCFERIFAQRTIRISNGVDFDSLPLKKNYRKAPQTLELISVSELHYWHGVDRAISGLYEYNKEKREQKVHLNVVGKTDSPTAQRLLEQVAYLHLEDSVTFFGALSGNELNSVFEKSDFAIGSLARHRSGITQIKTLKNREYAARGFGFIYSEEDSDFENQFYVLKASADEKAIDIAQIVDFYHKTELQPQQIRQTINPLLSWKNQMQIILNALER